MQFSHALHRPPTGRLAGCRHPPPRQPRHCQRSNACYRATPWGTPPFMPGASDA
ncbi:hypothetical protein YSA_03630 [Pseudomonas putida ND6]|uniref:Uncharacterized protein n=1 Tax=Pseudomonas putida ND6 TaxID=231023 RepID=I3UTA7_PSEPU|nr:hypothetical protein YSA_03630 [Pseudomonas putida ND6]